MGFVCAAEAGGSLSWVDSPLPMLMPHSADLNLNVESGWLLPLRLPPPPPLYPSTPPPPSLFPSSLPCLMYGVFLAVSCRLVPLAHTTMCELLW